MGKEEEESPKKNAWTFESGSPGWAGFPGSVTSSKAFLFSFCHSAQDLSSWTRDQTLGLAGNRLPGNSQARHFYSVRLSFLICKVRTRASIILVIMKIKGNVCYKDPTHGNQEQMLSLFFPVALNDIQINVFLNTLGFLLGRMAGKLVKIAGILFLFFN